MGSIAHAIGLGLKGSEEDRAVCGGEGAADSSSWAMGSIFHAMKEPTALLVGVALPVQEKLKDAHRRIADGAMSTSGRLEQLDSDAREQAAKREALEKENRQLQVGWEAAHHMGGWVEWRGRGGNCT